MNIVDAAASDGTLVPSDQKNADKFFDKWMGEFGQAVDRLEGGQKRAGCVGLRNLLREADGQPSPRDSVTGTSRAAVAAALQRLMDESGC